MHKPIKPFIQAAAALAAVTGGALPGHAQSADALIDKLVDKGILTVKEAKELREEADKGFTQAYQVKSGLPDWVTSFKIGGDFRGRYDTIIVPDRAAGAGAITDRHRFRYRMRLGVVATLRENFEVGLRLTSAEPKGAAGHGGDPISGNVSLQDNSSKKFVYFDQAYAKWGAINTPDFTLSGTIGKMENPFVLSEMVFDPDYTPEGAAFNAVYNAAEGHAVKFNGGGFILDELGGDSNDPFMLGAQLRWDAKWTPKIESSLGGALLSIVDRKHLTDGTSGSTVNVPHVNSGNSRSAAGVLLPAFTTFVADASATYNLESFPMYTGAFPIKIGAEYMENIAAPNRNQGYGFGVTFGKSGKKRTWDVSYRWKELQADAWYEEMVDSDFGGFYQNATPRAITTTGGALGYGPGTNLRGHVIRAQYSPYDFMTIGATVYIANVIETATAGGVGSGYKSDATRVQIDAVFKF